MTSPFANTPIIPTPSWAGIANPAGNFLPMSGTGQFTTTTGGYGLGSYGGGGYGIGDDVISGVTTTIVTIWTPFTDR